MGNLRSLSRMARNLGVPIDWLKGLADAGKVPCLRAGPDKLLFNAQAVQDALAVLASRAPTPGPADAAVTPQRPPSPTDIM
jgi:hypothetical protein